MQANVCFAVNRLVALNTTFSWHDGVASWQRSLVLEACELTCGMHDPPVHKGEFGGKTPDRLGGHREVVVRQDGNVHASVISNPSCA